MGGAFRIGGRGSGFVKTRKPDTPFAWPSLEEELRPWKHLLKGRVLNAGAGDRDLSPLVEGELVNQDIVEGLHNRDIHILSPLSSIPCPDDSFDCVVCNAVLEHVSSPDEVLKEFHRVLVPGGHLYLAVPFMQPEHLDPTDYQRYTRDGLRLLAERAGFTVVAVEDLHNVYVVLGWFVYCWLMARDTPSYRILRRVLFPWLRRKSRRSTTRVPGMASAYRLIGRKGGAP